MLVRRAVQFEDYPISRVVKQVVYQRDGHEKKDDENPSVVDDDIFQASVFVPRVGQKCRDGKKEKVCTSNFYHVSAPRLYH